MPALRLLRSTLPASRLTLASHGAAARLLQESGEVDEGFCFDDGSLTWLWGGGPPPPLALPLPLRGAAHVVAWVADPDRRLARRLREAGAASVLVAPSRPPDLDRHCAAHLAESLMPLTGPRWPLDCRPLRLRPERADELLVHPGSGAARKNWPATRFAAVVAALAARGAPVRLVVGEADGDAAASLESALGRPLPRLERRSLGQLAAALAGCRAYLGNDSGVSHLAGLVGARTVALFGPTPPLVWRPLGPRVTALPFTASDHEVVTALLDL